MTTQKVPWPSSFALTLSHSSTPHRVLLVSTHKHSTPTYTFKHTPVGVYSPNEGDHLLHYVPAEGDDHKQFLYDKERQRKSKSVTEP